MPEKRAEHSGVREYLNVLRRRKWLVLGSMVVGPALAVSLSLQQSPLYQGTAEVLLGHLNLAASLTGQQDLTPLLDPARLAQTQADVAEVPTVAARTLKATGLTHRTPAQFLSQSSVTAKQNADILEFRVSDKDRLLASRLASEYAHQFTIYRHELDTTALTRARQEVGQRLAQLEANGQQKSALYATLAGKDQELRTMEALQTANAYVVREAGNASQIRPRPARDGVLGLLFGLLVGIGLVLLREALDVRVRTSDGIGERLGMPLLARIPRPHKNVARRNRLTMIERPNSTESEAFRMLRTNLEFVNLERGARTIMVTSALEGEGKSTTVSNLAIALARAGRKVVLADFDLRRPFIHKFFDLGEAPGLTQVALGLASLDEAVVPIALTPSPVADAQNGNARKTRAGNGAAQVAGVLEVIGCGPIPPNPGEFIGTAALAQVIEQLAARAEIVLIDSPPLLGLGDGLTLSTRVDAMLIVVRLERARRPILNELRRVTETCPSPALGFLVTDAASEEGYGYGYRYGYYRYGYGYNSRVADTEVEEQDLPSAAEPPGGRLRSNPPR
jgi:succinoglycan biosynthesis transport protein ExoP